MILWHAAFLEKIPENLGFWEMPRRLRRSSKWLGLLRLRLIKRPTANFVFSALADDFLHQRRQQNLALNQPYLSRAKMPCRTKSGTRKTGSQNAKKPPTKKSGKTASKSVDTKENRYITDFFPTVSRRMLAAKLKLDNENKLIRQCVESCTDPVDNLMITEFENKGKGIVARVPIRKDSFICEYSGDLIKLEDAEVKPLEFVIFCLLNLPFF